MAIDKDVTDILDAIEYVGVDPIGQRNAINAIIHGLSAPGRDAPVVQDDGIPPPISVIDETNIGTVVDDLRKAAITMGCAKNPE